MCVRVAGCAVTFGFCLWSGPRRRRLLLHTAGTLTNRTKCLVSRANENTKKRKCHYSFATCVVRERSFKIERIPRHCKSGFPTGLSVTEKLNILVSAVNTTSQFRTIQLHKQIVFIGNLSCSTARFNEIFYLFFRTYFHSKSTVTV